MDSAGISISFDPSTSSSSSLQQTPSTQPSSENKTSPRNTLPLYIFTSIAILPGFLRGCSSSLHASISDFCNISMQLHNRSATWIRLVSNSAFSGYDFLRSRVVEAVHNRIHWNAVVPFDGGLLEFMNRSLTRTYHQVHSYMPGLLSLTLNGSILSRIWERKVSGVQEVELVDAGQQEGGISREIIEENVTGDIDIVDYIIERPASPPPPCPSSPSPSLLKNIITMPTIIEEEEPKDIVEPSSPSSPENTVSDLLSSETAYDSSSRKSASIISLFDKEPKRHRVTDVCMLSYLLSHWDKFCNYVDNDGISVTPHLKLRFSVDDLSWTYSGTTFAFDRDLVNDSLVEIILSNERSVFSTIPSNIDDFCDLRYLDLSNCGLSGSIVSTIGNLEHLEVLILSENKLSGELPSELGYLYRLRMLDVSTNMLTGTLPRSLGHLSKLQFLDVSHNRIEGVIPHEYGHLHALRTLNLRNNRIEGVISASLKNLQSVREIELADNMLVGLIPMELGFLEHLTTLDLTSNQLTGRVPVELAHLEGLRIKGNKIKNMLSFRLRRALSTGHLPSDQNLQTTNVTTKTNTNNTSSSIVTTAGLEESKLAKFLHRRRSLFHSPPTK
ncbi:hypothetical protein BC829DRAFT_69684 [Chytridium lagenaria]|nr:hypothetical protein BC829DRAFT_69684 [Chytridium lagenaria]